MSPASRNPGRDHPRVEAAFRVRYRTLDQLVIGYSNNLSKGGLFLASDHFLPVNAVIRLHLELPDGGGEAAAICRIAYVRDAAESASTGKPAGMGVEFIDQSDELRRTIERFIAERSAAPMVDVIPAEERTPLNILVAEDDPRYREMTVSIFRDRGDLVREAFDGLEALALCLKNPPEVILSDVQMPRMDGWQLLRIVRARPSLAAIPVIFLTTLRGEEDRLLGYQRGVDDYIAKPYRAEEVAARVDRVVQRARANRSAAVERRTLRGDLAQVGLASVLAFLEVERKTGVLMIVGVSTARVFLRDGRALRVEIDDTVAGRTAVELLFDLLDWRAGQFEFATQDVACQDDLRSPITPLLLEHARRRDERRSRA